MGVITPILGLLKPGLGKGAGRVVITSLVTPFRDGGVDERAFVFLCRRQIDRGASGLLVGAVAGEAPTLNRAELMRLVELAVMTAAGRVPVIAGIAADCTDAAVAQASAAAACGASAVLSAMPFYGMPTPEGIFQHFKEVQSKGALPMLLYDDPARTGRSLPISLLARLGALSNIVGLVDASGDLERVRLLKTWVDEDFLSFCANDAALPAYLAAGAAGSVSVMSNVAPALCAAMHRAWRGAGEAKFRRLWLIVAPLAEALRVETNPIAVKWALSRLGLIDGGLRLPLTRLDAASEPALLAALDAVVDAESRWSQML